VAFVVASAAFSATGNLQSNANRVQPAGVSWSTSSSAVFEGDTAQIVQIGWSATANTQIQPHVVRGGVLNWTATAGFTALVPKIQYAEAAFDGVASVFFVVDAKFATGDWAADGSITIEGTRRKPGNGTWSTSCDLEIGNLKVDAAGFVDWSAGATEWLIESSVLSGGVLTIDGTFRPTVTADWQTNASGVHEVITSVPWDVSGELSLPAQVTKQGSAAWEAGVATWYAIGVPQVITKGNWTTTSSFGGEATHTYSDISGFVSHSIINIAAVQTHAGRVNWAGTAGWDALSTANKRASAAWEGVALIGLKGERVYYETFPIEASASLEMQGAMLVFARGDWPGMGSWLSASAVLSLEPAPPERRLALSARGRNFVLSGGLRQMELSE
jgi:hypothetical protein